MQSKAVVVRDVGLSRTEERAMKLYMCKTDFECELGAADPAGVKVYPSLSGIKKWSKCVAECGIVEVEVTLKRVVQKAKYPKVKT